MDSTVNQIANNTSLSTTFFHNSPCLHLDVAVAVILSCISSCSSHIEADRGGHFITLPTVTLLSATKLVESGKKKKKSVLSVGFMDEGSLSFRF